MNEEDGLENLFNLKSQLGTHLLASECLNLFLTVLSEGKILRNSVMQPNSYTKRRSQGKCQNWNYRRGIKLNY